MIVLLHSSKTMRDRSTEPHVPLRAPQLVAQATQIDAYLKTLSAQELATSMHLSPALAQKTHELIEAWNTDPARQTPAIDAFIGDIYSGLRANDFTADERSYADKTLYILSGQYGVLRALDGIFPYRLEMGYKLPAPEFKNLYKFWGDAIARCLPETGTIVNASSAEYMQTVLPFVDQARVVTPQFLTVDPKTHQPAFKVVHAKIARGAFARWMIKTRVQTAAELTGFDDLGYRYDPALSTPAQPTFVCQTFEGKGLSMKTPAKS